MAVIKKTLFPKNLDKFAVLVNDTQSDSKYFKITELPDTFTGGKNAFLIAGSEYLVPDTKIQIELKDSAGNVIYHEPGEGYFSSSLDGDGFITEYYEGVSKVVAVYVYPDTAYGPCTLTILGELNEYEDGNGITTPVPLDWENKYNVKWQKQIDVNPSLANTTKIRFYRRPTVSITELLEPIYRIDNGEKVNSGVSQSFADIKISNLETFAGDVKRVKVFRTSLGDISDFSLVQDILVESKELLTTFGLSGSVIGNTGTFTSETVKNFWNTGSLNVKLTNDRVESGIRLTGSGNFAYTASLDIRNANTYELNFDAFYSSSTNSNLGIYLSQVTTSMVNGVPTPTTISSSIATLSGTQPTKNLLDTVIPFKLDRNYPDAKLYFSQSQGEWHLGNVSLRLSQDTAFSPDEISFITTMPTSIGNEDFNFKFEFYDVNNNYVPVAVTQSANFTGGNLNRILRSLTFDSDRNAFRFSTGSIGNPIFQTIGFTVAKVNLTGSVTYGRSVFDLTGSYIDPSIYSSAPGGPFPYPGEPTNPNENGFIAHIDEFTGSLANILVGSIVYTASCDGLHQHETVYRFEDGDNAPGVFVTSNTNQFIYKATDLSLNPTGQIITIEAKRKNLASADTPLTINIQSSSVTYPAPALTMVGVPNTATGVDTYTINGTDFRYEIGETIYFISGSDQFGNEFSDAVKITPVKILDGFSVAVTNENTSFPANSVGAVLGGFSASSGSITVKVGNEVINYSPTFITNSFSASISSTTGLTANTFNGTNYSINALSQDSGSLSLLVKYKDGGGTIISSSKDITYSKVKKAAPVLTFVIGNNNQSADAKSTGAQLTAFSDSTLSVKEQYNGVNTNLTLVSAPTINSSSTFTPITKTTTNLSYPNMVNGTDSVELSITGSVIDSEGVNRQVFGNVSLTKIKKAQPTITFVITPPVQTVAANSAGTLTGTIIDPILTAFEGSAALTYNQGTLTASQYKITNVTGVTVNNPTPNTSTIDVTGISANDNTGIVSIAFKDSEGTDGTTTIRFTISKAIAGVQGDPGAGGADGKRTATGMVFYQLTSTSAPTTPTAASYTFSTNLFGTLTTNWGVGAPTYTAGNTNKYWYSTFTAIETTAGGGTAVPTFSAPVQAINFTGLVTFTSTNNITDGVNTSNIVEPGSVTNHIGGANVTTIEGGKVSTGVITSTGYTLTGSDTLASGSFTGGGTIFNLNNGSLRSKNFYIASNGDAVFKGTMQIGGTDLTATNTLNANTTATQVGLGNVENLNAQSQAQTGLIAGTIITGGGITLSNGGNIKGGQTDYNTGTGFFLGYHGSAYKFSIGNASSKGITWDGDALSIGGDVTIGGTLASTVRSGAASGASALQAGQAAGDVNNNTTNISGNKIRTGIIESTGFDIVFAAPLRYSVTGTRINLNNGVINAKNFAIDADGNAFFRGNLVGAGGTFSGNLVAAGGDFSGTVTAGAGAIGGWQIGQSQINDTSNKMRLSSNPLKPSMEIYDGNNLAVDISSATTLSTIIAGGSSTTNLPYTTTAVVEGTYYDLTTYPEANQMEIGSDPLFASTSLPTFTPDQSGVYNAAITLGGTVSAARGIMEPGGGSPTPGFVRLYASYTIGISIRTGAGAEVANMSQYVDWSQDLTGGTSFNRTSAAAVTLTTTLTVTSGTVYTLIPYIRFGQAAAEISSGNISTLEFRGTYRTPTISTATIAKTLSKTELVAGGFQVVADTDRYCVIERNAANATFVRVGGGISATGNITAFATSDKRLKKNIITINNPLDKINKLDGVEFDWTDEYINRESNGEGEDGYFVRKHDVGLIAQQVEEVLPEVVGKRKDGYLAIKYDRIVPLLIESIKELKREIDNLKNTK